MRAKLTQAILIISTLIASNTCRADSAQTLAAECDNLLRTAVRRPYGWAWGPTSGENEGKRIDPVNVSFAPLNTPSIGLLLYLAGAELHEPKYQQAAIQAARGLATAQEHTGRVPVIATFGRSGASRDQPTLIADRAPTRAALALWLTILQDQEKPDPVLHGAAIRAAYWLVKQQPRAGGFPIAYPPDADIADATRLFRMDLPEDRDSILALLLSYEVLHDNAFRHAFESTVDHLLRLQLDDPPSARGLWCTAYELGGNVTARFPEMPRGVDVLATRYSIQALLAVHVAIGTQTAATAVQQAADALPKLPQPDGQWRQVYRLFTRPPPQITATPTTLPATTQIAATQPATTQPAEREVFPSGNFGIPAALDAIARVNEAGRVKYANAIDWKKQIPLTLAGLWDEVITTPLPETPDQLKAYLTDHPDLQQALDPKAAEEVPTQTKRLWLRLLQSRLPPSS